MQKFLFLIFVAVASSRIEIVDVHHSYGTCHDYYSSANSRSTFDKLYIQPYPVPFKERRQLNISAQFDIKEVIPKGANITVEIFSDKNSWDPDIPC